MVKPAWEFQLQQPSVLIAISSVGPVSYEWSCAFAELWSNRPPGAARMRLPPYVIDQAREQGALTALQSGFRWIFYLDSDVLPPPDIIQRLMVHNKRIVSALYARRHQPMYPFLLRKTSENPIAFGLIPDYQAGSLVEVDVAPAGALLVSTEVFRKVPRPWFFWSADRVLDIGGQPITFTTGTSEDYQFCIRAKQYGIRTWVDTAIKCRHKGEFNVVPGDKFDINLQTEAPNP